MQVCLLSRYRLSNCIPKLTRVCCALQSAVERAISCSSLRHRSLWIIRETDDRRIPLHHLKFLWLFGGSSWLSNSDSTVSTLSSVRALRLPLLRRLSTDPIPNFTSSLLMLFFVQAMLRNFVILSTVERCNLYIHTDFWSNFNSFTEQRRSFHVCLIQR